jgi:hypothetical protein
MNPGAVKRALAGGPFGHCNIIPRAIARLRRVNVIWVGDWYMQLVVLGPARMACLLTGSPTTAECQISGLPIPRSLSPLPLWRGVLEDWTPGGSAGSKVRFWKVWSKAIISQHQDLESGGKPKIWRPPCGQDGAAASVEFQIPAMREGLERPRVSSRNPVRFSTNLENSEKVCPSGHRRKGLVETWPSGMQA